MIGREEDALDPPGEEEDVGWSDVLGDGIEEVQGGELVGRWAL